MDDLKKLYNFYLEQKEKPKIKKENIKFLELALLRGAIDKLLKEMEV